MPLGSVAAIIISVCIVIGIFTLCGAASCETTRERHIIITKQSKGEKKKKKEEKDPTIIV